MKAIVNDSVEFSLEDSPQWDFVKVKANQFHVLYKNKSFVADIISIDHSVNRVEMLINNRLYSVAIHDKFDMLLNQLGMAVNSSTKENKVKAPMPGRILDVLVSAGDVISEGDNVLVLEAMKMENIIKSSRPGRIKNVGVQQGDSVDKNAVLIEFE